MSSLITDKSVDILSHAKINWFLNVGNSVQNGYHQLQTFMQQISLYDTINIKSIDENIVVLNDFNNKSGCTPKENIIVKSALKLKEIFNINSGISVSLKKNIPVCAGLGGGSSNAAAILKALISLWDIKISATDLNNIAVSIGADVPFFLDTYAGICEGIGEKVAKIKPKYYNLVLWNPGVPLSTSMVYKQFDQKIRNEKIFINDFLVTYNSGNLLELSKKIWNNLAFAAEELLPKLKKMKVECLRNGAITSWISGSGPTVVSLCANASEAKKVVLKLRRDNPNDFIIECETIIDK